MYITSGWLVVVISVGKLFLLLCEGGCFVEIFGIGLGLIIMSPHRRGDKCAM